MYTGPAQLRPMNLGDLLDRTFFLYRQNFTLFAGVVAVLAVPQAILAALVSLPSSLGAAVLFAAIGTLLGFVFSTLITGALAVAISARYLDRPMTVGGAYEALGTDTFITLLVASILQGIVIAIGFVLLIIPGIYLLVRLLFVPEAVVLERKSVGAAFSRSADLVRGSWWRVFGIGLVVIILVGILESIVGAIVGGIFAVGGGKVVGSVVSALVGIVIQPIQAGALVLLYYDLRVRKEGFDIEAMVQTLGPQAPYPR